MPNCFFFLSLQAAVAVKDIELQQHKALVQELRQQVNGLQLDSDKTSLVMLQQVKMTCSVPIVLCSSK